MMGETDPLVAAEKNVESLRAIYGKSIKENALHGSSNPEHADRGVKLLFTDADFVAGGGQPELGPMESAAEHPSGTVLGGPEEESPGPNEEQLIQKKKRRRPRPRAEGATGLVEGEERVVLEAEEAEEGEFEEYSEEEGVEAEDRHTPTPTAEEGPTMKPEPKVMESFPAGGSAEPDRDARARQKADEQEGAEDAQREKERAEAEEMGGVLAQKPIEKPIPLEGTAATPEPRSVTPADVAPARERSSRPVSAKSGAAMSIKSNTSAKPPASVAKTTAEILAETPPEVQPAVQPEAHPKEPHQEHPAVQKDVPPVEPLHVEQPEGKLSEHAGGRPHSAKRETKFAEPHKDHAEIHPGVHPTEHADGRPEHLDGKQDIKEHPPGHAGHPPGHDKEHTPEHPEHPPGHDKEHPPEHAAHPPGHDKEHPPEHTEHPPGHDKEHPPEHPEHPPGHDKDHLHERDDENSPGHEKEHKERSRPTTGKRPESATSKGSKK